MKLIKRTVAILLVLVAFASSTALAAGGNDITIQKGEPVECIYVPVTASLRAAGDVWSYSSTIERTVLGEEVERVNGWSKLTNSSGTNLNHYSRAYYQMPVLGIIINDTGYKYGYGQVYAITDWLSAFTALAYVGKFNYGV